MNITTTKLLVAVGVALAVTTAVKAQGLGFITGSTTRGTRIDTNATRLTVRDLVGKNSVQIRHFGLDGRRNSVRLNIAGIRQEINLDDASGSLTADLRIARIGVVKERGTSRHFILISGEAGGFEVRIELDYVPGMVAITGSTAQRNVTPTPYKIIFRNKRSGNTRIISGVAGALRN